MPTTLRIASLNLDWKSTREHRERQQQTLSAGDFDVVLLQEARAADVEALMAGGDFDWSRHSLGATARPGVLGVAVLGRGVVPRESHQLTQADFMAGNTELYDDLARWFHERHLAVDLALADGRTLRVLSAHATPGTSRGPGMPKRGVGILKPWFHTRLADWITTWNDPFLFAIDANTPKFESLDADATQFHQPASNHDQRACGEDHLLGGSGAARHRARDLWREWLDTPQGAATRAAVPADGPLARSHRTGGRWYRYDHIWASSDVTPTDMKYEYDPELSDHALVTATITV